MGIEAKIWKLILGGINMYKVYNFHTMVYYHGIEMCDAKGVHSINMNMLIQCAMAQKSATFCISWKEKILDEPFFKNQQNTSHNKIDL